MTLEAELANVRPQEVENRMRGRTPMSAAAMVRSPRKERVGAFGTCQSQSSLAIEDACAIATNELPTGPDSSRESSFAYSVFVVEQVDTVSERVRTQYFRLVERTCPIAKRVRIGLVGTGNKMAPTHPPHAGFQDG